MNSKLTLPLFIHKNNRLLMAILCGVAFFFGYTIPNHYHLYQPRLLPLTEMDMLIPLVPWTIFIYLSEYFLFVSAYFLFKSEYTRNRYIWGYFGVLFVGMIIFVFFPTAYPRSEYPLPADIHPFVFKVFAGLREIDNPSNCLPSMHVACCYLTALAFWSEGEKRSMFWGYFIWASLVAFSTLPTKQHYIADVVAGMALAGAGYWVFFKKVRYVTMSEFVSRFTSGSRI